MALTDYYTNFTLSKRTHSGFSGASWSAGTTYTGFIQPVSGSDRFKEGKSGEDITHRLYTDIATPVEYGDRVTQNSVTYTAVSTVQPAGVSGVGSHKEILLGLFE
jgi:hypothetical protein